MQIRILKPRSNTSASISQPLFMLAQYAPNPTTPPLIGLMNGTADQAALSACQSRDVLCEARAFIIGAVAAYPEGQSQVAIPAVAQPIQPAGSRSGTPICVRKVLYEPTRLDKDSDGKPLLNGYGLCIYLAALKDVDNLCDASQRAPKTDEEDLNWVQTYMANQNDPCTPKVPHKDQCTPGRPPYLDHKENGPLYRPDQDSTGDNNLEYTSAGPNFSSWKQQLGTLGDLQLLFRDIPSRVYDGTGFKTCRGKIKLISLPCVYTFHTAQEDGQNSVRYVKPSAPANYTPSQSDLDNDLRLVKYSTNNDDPYHFNYTPLIRVLYGYSVNQIDETLTVDPLEIGGRIVDKGGTISLKNLSKLNPRSSACWSGSKHLENFPQSITPFPYDTRPD